MKDPTIGERAFYELTSYVYDTGEDIANWCKHSGISREVLYGWRRSGTSPSALMLKNMVEMGIDVLYILTGRRTTNGNQTERKQDDQEA